MPLTHYERTQKYAAACDNGTQSQRLAGHSQYQMGECALTTQRLSTSMSMSSPLEGGGSSGSSSSMALCSPSGYLYAESAILEYLLKETVELKQAQDRQTSLEMQLEQERRENELDEQQKRIADFRDSQHIVVRGSRSRIEEEDDVKDLHRVSYWLSSAQPVVKKGTNGIPVAAKDNSNKPLAILSQQQQPILALMAQNSSNNTISAANGGMTNVDISKNNNNDTVDTTIAIPKPRPVSPMTGEPLRRKDLWPVRLEWEQQPSSKASKLSETNSGSSYLQCAVSHQSIATGAAVLAYWTTTTARNPKKSSSRHNQQPGTLILQSVYDELQLATNATCPLTDRPIADTRQLQKSGSSFAASGQAVEAKRYRPTIT